MSRDRSWMNWKSYRCRQNLEYINGVNEFLDFAFANVAKEGKIRCPCVNYDNFYHQSRKAVLFHLLHDGILRNSNPWEFYGGKSAVEGHIDEGDGNKSDAKECVDPEESGEAVD